MIKTFFRTLFGEVGNGRLNRVQFIGFTFLVTVLMMIVVFAVIAGVAGAERSADNIQEFQQMMAEKYGMAFVVGLMILGSVFTFASLNIAAKRIRDMGLPAWPTVLAMVIIGVVIGILFPGEMVSVNGGPARMQPSFVSATYQAIVFLALTLIPGNTFGKRD